MIREQNIYADVFFVFYLYNPRHKVKSHAENLNCAFYKWVVYYGHKILFLSVNIYCSVLQALHTLYIDLAGSLRHCAYCTHSIITIAANRREIGGRQRAIDIISCPDVGYSL